MIVIHDVCVEYLVSVMFMFPYPGGWVSNNIQAKLAKINMKSGLGTKKKLSMIKMGGHAYTHAHCKHNSI